MTTMTSTMTTTMTTTMPTWKNTASLCLHSGQGLSLDLCRCRCRGGKGRGAEVQRQFYKASILVSCLPSSIQPKA